MMSHKSKILAYIIIALSAAAFIYGGVFYWKNLRGLGPAVRSPTGDIGNEIGQSGTPKPGQNDTQFPLTLKPGFNISVFAKDLPGARVLVFDRFNNAWLSQTRQGQVSLIEISDGKVVRHGPVLRNLDNPHGLAFDPELTTKLYIAQEEQIISIPTYSDGGPEKVATLPKGGNHTTRTLGFGSDNKLYVSIGSTCNVCNESDGRIAKIHTVDTATGALKEFARGLRNAVFFTFNPKDGKMWATEMGRDLLGDDIPPDEINIIEEGKNYGWPICYGKNIHDTNFDKNTYIRNPCMEPFETASHIDLQAHSAPLGIVFVPQNVNWPSEYKGDLLVAFHGSWNRSDPTGYKIVRIKLGAGGEYEGIEDFIYGWLDNNGDNSSGRPVDLKFGPDGNLYVTDDKAGLVYKVHYNRQ
jgi:glucose/arabinose dehydrogenase